MADVVLTWKGLFSGHLDLNDALMLITDAIRDKNADVHTDAAAIMAARQLAHDAYQNASALEEAKQAIAGYQAMLDDIRTATGTVAGEPGAGLQSLRQVVTELRHDHDEAQRECAAALGREQDEHEAHMLAETRLGDLSDTVARVVDDMARWGAPMFIIERDETLAAIAAYRAELEKALANITTTDRTDGPPRQKAEATKIAALSHAYYALLLLVRVKDGLRDKAYVANKKRAWAEARRAISDVRAVYLAAASAAED